MPKSRPRGPRRGLAATPSDEWWPALQALLIRDRALDELAKERYAKDTDTEKAPVTLHHNQLRSKLSKLFQRYECIEFIRCLWGQQPLPYFPPPDVEIAALHAVEEWLKPAPTFPSYATPDEQQELRELRSSLKGSVKEQMLELAGVAAEDPAEMPFEGFGLKSRHLLVYLWDHGRMPPRTIATVMKKLGYTPTASKIKKDTFRTLLYRVNVDLEAMESEKRYVIEKNKKENTIRLVELEH